jgi:hypothetical protein
MLEHCDCTWVTRTNLEINTPKDLIHMVVLAAGVVKLQYVLRVCGIAVSLAVGGEHDYWTRG